VPGSAASSVTVTGPDGKPVPAQVLGGGIKDGKQRVAFVAKAPQVGFAAYSIAFSADKPASEGSLKVTEKSLENDYYIVKLDDIGDVASITDKKAKHELLSGPARLGLHYENPAQWPAWNQDWEDRIKPAKAYVGGPATFKVVENGPARVAVE